MPAEERGSLLRNRDFLLVTASGFFVIGSFFSTFPLVPRYVTDELGRGSVAVGISVGAFAVSAIAIRPWVNRMGDERGRRILIIGGTVVIVIGLAAHIAAVNIWLLVLVRLVLGAGQAAFFVGAATMITDLAPPDQRGRAVNYFSVAVYGSNALGPFFGEAMEDIGGFDLGFGAAAALAAVAIVLAVFIREERPASPPPQRTATSLRDRFLHPAALAPGVVLMMGTTTFVALTGFVPLYVDDLGLAGTAPLFAMYGVIVIVMRSAGASIPDRLGTVPTATAALTGIALGMGVVAAWRSPTGLYLGVAVWALGISVLYPALFVRAIDGVPDHERASATGSFTMFFEIAGGIGGPILGVAAALGGTRSAFAVASVYGVIGLVLLHGWMSRRPPYEPTPILPA